MNSVLVGQRESASFRLEACFQELICSCHQYCDQNTRPKQLIVVVKNLKQDSTSCIESENYPATKGAACNLPTLRCFV